MSNFVELSKLLEENDLDVETFLLLIKLLLDFADG